MSKIIELKAENVKRLKAVSITPTEQVVIIGGNNGQGKTSVLDAIEMALAGAASIPPKPVREGETRATIELNLGDLRVRRVITDNGQSSLVVENERGIRQTSPQSLLDKLTGRLTFDPLAFTRLDQKAQVATLKTLAGLDLSDLDTQRKNAYDERTITNRLVERLRTQLQTLDLPKDAPEAITDTKLILAQLEAATASNNAIRSITAKIEAFTEREQIIQKNIEQAQADLKEAQDSLAALKEQLKGKEIADLTPLKEQLLNAESLNRKYNAALTFKGVRQEYDEETKKSEGHTKRIEEIDAQKQKMLEDAKFPIAGLSFDENGVTFNGIPFSQISGAEQLKTGIAIAAAMNTTLRIMLIRDGSLLDAGSMQVLRDMAQQLDLQVWIERVGDGDPVAVVIEDGEVKAK